MKYSLGVLSASVPQIPINLRLTDKDVNIAMATDGPVPVIVSGFSVTKDVAEYDLENGTMSASMMLPPELGMDESDLDEDDLEDEEDEEEDEEDEDEDEEEEEEEEEEDEKDKKDKTTKAILYKENPFAKDEKAKKAKKVADSKQLSDKTPFTQPAKGTFEQKSENTKKEQQKPAPEKKSKKEEKKPEPKKNEKDNKPKAASPAQPAKDTTQRLRGGVIAHDEVVGKGKKATSGMRVKMLYEGRLNNAKGKLFDQNKDKKHPFMFRLGVGEVISGWDIGVAGMQIGGVRTLTIPPEMGYGARGAPPDIPKNATLWFRVQLVDC
eukprot:MONOS_14089.1-p1 / transcript=MONOS_14089.1 / gene=MONOS_14089 / organism=Monocercomonoides_exilis_PA203 / gene_product=peptidylprolyl cis-trans isomerase, FKBP-type domain containing protein / transcript_product=peptidylprolyl cis-trans isomerase, FKBP-type domain containing protein / location=Mono_scaffold00935:731-1751(+) / protein_length=322 / sequence_SO=supercontig / SO=protein_coding / is_pseudo=false